MCNFRMRTDVEADSESAHPVHGLVLSNSDADQQNLALSSELPHAPIFPLGQDKIIKCDNPKNAELPLIDAGAVLPAIPENEALTELAAKKRPVGRPRIHPKKIIDPNRVKRVAKGDKPLGRPRSSHLKPPMVKRPRGRPRKDITKEILPIGELTHSSNKPEAKTTSTLTGDWRSIMNSAPVDDATDIYYNSNCSSHNSSRSSSHSEISFQDLSNISTVAALCADMYETSFVSQPMSMPLPTQGMPPQPPQQDSTWTGAYTSSSIPQEDQTSPSYN